MADQTSDPRTAFARFFSKPVVGIAGSIASIIGLILAIYFYEKSTGYRDLVYLVHPAKAVVVKSGQLSRLSVILDGKTLQADLTAAQVAFWNEGNEAIRKEHVLQPFIISTTPQARIIEATIRKRSRDVVQIHLDTSHLDEGQLGISWNILERGDGGVVQIIFAGPPSTPISAGAVVEAQRTVRKVEPWAAESSEDRYGGFNRRIRLLALIYFGAAIVMAGIGYFLLVSRRRHGRPMDAFRIAILVIGPGFMILAAIVMVLFIRQPEPPFGF